MIKTPAYDEMYLQDVKNVHRYLFAKMNDAPYDTFSMISVYMQCSQIRGRMDVGNYSALNKSAKQLFNDIDLTLCEKKNKKEYDKSALEWMADMYVLLQWKFGIYSKELIHKIPVEEMHYAYLPLHEISYKAALQKLYDRYLHQW